MTNDLVDRLKPQAVPGARSAGALALLTAALFYLAPPPVRLNAQDAELLVAPGKLSRVHAGLAGLNNCVACHTERKKVDAGKCLACHGDLAARVKAGRGFHKGKGTNCLPCHPEHLGEEFKLIEWDLKKFSHAETGYPLVGRHQKVAACAACHTPARAPAGKKEKSYLLKDAKCSACHADAHQGRLGTACADCHSPAVPFREAVFDHGRSGFPLRGAHRGLPCAQCHPTPKRLGPARSRCSDCHSDPHRPAYDQSCSTCHDENSWKTSRFDHDRTGFPLRGKHVSLACAQCHPPGAKTKKVAFADCSDCHRRDPHRGQFGRECRACHVVSGFANVSFDHGKTGYPLTGRHAGVSCRQCHQRQGGNQPPVYRSTPTACGDCHRDTHRGQFAKSCDACHTTQGFGPEALKFDHQRDSAFPLQGKHAAASCQKCHVKATRAFPAGSGEAVLYKPLASACASCHADYHQQQMGSDCQRCHGFAAFRPAPGFDHERTRFPLRPFHETVACRQCHPSRQSTAGGKTAAVVQYAGITLSCRECHKDFDHARTAFPLTGSHGALECSACHNDKTANTRKAAKGKAPGLVCTACHKSPHLGQSQDCRQCHSLESWKVEPW
jgi:hypothetical protein